MKITVVGVGKIKEKYFTDAIKEYAKRLSRYCKLEIRRTGSPDGALECRRYQSDRICDRWVSGTGTCSSSES